MKTKIFLSDEEVKEAVRKYSETLQTWYTKGYSPNEITFNQVKDGIECTLTWNHRNIKTTALNNLVFNTTKEIKFGSGPEGPFGQ